MDSLDLERHRPAAADGRRPIPAPAREREEGAWHVYPLDGALDVTYRDVAGRPSRRRILARELKVGPGKVLLGGIDTTVDEYRGFRADRIRRIVETETGNAVDRNIVDWLLKQAQDQARERKRTEQAAQQDHR